MDAYFEMPTYAERGGSWKEVMPDELVKFIAHLIYIGVVHIAGIHLYWNTSKKQRFYAKSARVHLCHEKPGNASPHCTSSEAAPGFGFFFVYFNRNIVQNIYYFLEY